MAHSRDKKRKHPPGVVIIAHGGSSALAIKNAIKMAASAIKQDINHKIEDAIESANQTPSEQS